MGSFTASPKSSSRATSKSEALPSGFGQRTKKRPHPNGRGLFRPSTLGALLLKLESVEVAVRSISAVDHERFLFTVCTPFDLRSRARVGAVALSGGGETVPVPRYRMLKVVRPRANSNPSARGIHAEEMLTSAEAVVETGVERKVGGVGRDIPNHSATSADIHTLTAHQTWRVDRLDVQNELRGWCVARVLRKQDENLAHAWGVSHFSQEDPTLSVRRKLDVVVAAVTRKVPVSTLLSDSKNSVSATSNGVDDVVTVRLHLEYEHGIPAGHVCAALTVVLGVRIEVSTHADLSTLGECQQLGGVAVVRDRWRTPVGGVPVAVLVDIIADLFGAGEHVGVCVVAVELVPTHRTKRIAVLVQGFVDAHPDVRVATVPGAFVPVTTIGFHPTLAAVSCALGTSKTKPVIAKCVVRLVVAPGVRAAVQRAGDTIITEAVIGFEATLSAVIVAAIDGALDPIITGDRCSFLAAAPTAGFDAVARESVVAIIIGRAARVDAAHHHVAAFRICTSGVVSLVDANRSDAAIESAFDSVAAVRGALHRKRRISQKRRIRIHHRRASNQKRDGPYWPLH